MTDGARAPRTPDATASFAFNVIASLIATALVFAGSWLAGKQVPDEIALQFTFSEQRAGRLASWHFQLINASDVAFNVKITPPQVKLFKYEFSLASDGGSTWTGQLKKGQRMDVLFVVEDPTARLSSAVVQSMIAAAYEDRNLTTGVMEPKTGEVKEVGVVGFARSALLVFWFFLPITLAGLLLLAIKVWKWWRTRRPPPSTGNAGNAA